VAWEEEKPTGGCEVAFSSLLKKQAQGASQHSSFEVVLACSRDVLMKRQRREEVFQRQTEAMSSQGEL
jgi:hypothetical protein